MARDYAKTNFAIWQDPDWRALPILAQHFYKMLWEHSEISWCGVVDWRPLKLVGRGSGWTPDLVSMVSDCLRARHFLVVDEDTEECLVRSWIRFDGLMRQPRLAASMTKAFVDVGSNNLRGAIVYELAKLQRIEPEAKGWTHPSVIELLQLPQVNAKALPVPADPFVGDFDISFRSVSGSLSVSVSDAFGRNSAHRLGDVYNPPTTATATSQQQHLNAADPEPVAEGSDTTPPTSSADAEREDVERLCKHLADRVESNGSKRPTIGKTWRDAARLMLDRDQRTELQIHAAIDWCQNDEFWRANVMSMPTLRQKYDQLRLKAQQEQGKGSGRPFGVWHPDGRAPGPGEVATDGTPLPPLPPKWEDS